MSELPKGWVEIKALEGFDQVSINGKNVKTKECLVVGKFPVIDQGTDAVSGFINDETKVIKVEGRPIILFGDHTRVVKWIINDFVPGADGTKLLQAKNFILPRFAFFQLRSLDIPDRGYARHFKFLKELSFFIPPLAEQKRIVEKLDQVLAQVDTIKARLDGIPAILKCFRQSVLAAAVSGKLTEEWRKKTHLSLSSWSFEAAEKACTKVQSGSTPRNNPFDQGGTIPFLKVYNIVEQEISFDYRPQFVTKDVHSGALGRSIALPNDVLMNIVGPPLGKVAILTDQFPEWNINQAITLFRTDENTLSHKFLYYVLREGELVRKVMPDTKGSVGQVNISLSQCRNAIIPVPSLKEQTEIVRLVDQYFDFADTIEKQVQKAQQRVDKLTQSILAKAFRGELVPQDPNDEPADELLKRIAAARAESEALAKAAKKVSKKK